MFELNLTLRRLKLKHEDQYTKSYWFIAGGRKLLLPIAIHEFGHSLGLGHSKDKDSIMYGYYMSNNVVNQLNEDDIEGIQALYGIFNHISRL